MTKLELKLTDMSEELNAWATESGQIHEEIAHTHSMLEGASMQIEDIPKNMEKERVQYQGVVVLSFSQALIIVGMIIALIMMC